MVICQGQMTIKKRANNAIFPSNILFMSRYTTHKVRHATISCGSLTTHIFGPKTAMNGIISEDSTFGKALMGAREGQQVTVVAPAGEIQYTVDKIER